MTVRLIGEKPSRPAVGKGAEETGLDRFEDVVETQQRDQTTSADGVHKPKTNPVLPGPATAKPVSGRNGLSNE